MGWAKYKKILTEAHSIGPADLHFFSIFPIFFVFFSGHFFTFFVDEAICVWTKSMFRVLQYTATHRRATTRQLVSTKRWWLQLSNEATYSLKYDVADAPEVGNEGKGTDLQTHVSHERSGFAQNVKGGNGGLLWSKKAAGLFETTSQKN